MSNRGTKTHAEDGQSQFRCRTLSREALISEPFPSRVATRGKALGPARAGLAEHVGCQCLLVWEMWFKQ